MIQFFYNVYRVISIMISSWLTVLFPTLNIFFKFFVRLIGIYDIRFTNRRIWNDEINDPRNHPWDHQPDQNDEQWELDFDPNERVFGEIDRVEWNRPYDIQDFFDLINQLNYQFLIFSFLSIFNLVLINYINSDYNLLIQELKNFDIIIKELYFNHIQYEMYLLHLFNIILNDDYCDLIINKVNFLHLSNVNNYGFIINENLKSFMLLTDKNSIFWKNGIFQNNSLSKHIELMENILNSKLPNNNLEFKNDFFKIRVEALNELIFLKDKFSEFQKIFELDFKQLKKYEDTRFFIFFNVCFYGLIAFLSVQLSI